MRKITDNLKRIVGKGDELDYTAAMELYRQGQYEEAIARFDTIIVPPFHARALIGKGKCFHKLGRLDLAIQCFEKVLASEPDHLDALFQKGVNLVYLGKIREAMESFDRILEIDSESADTWENKAICFKLLGKSNEAEHCVNTAMKIRGEYRTYQPLLGQWFGNK
jgi:tetratricopeptide (TPR) repeat protein